MTLTIKNANVYSRGKFIKCNIVVENGVIKSLGNSIEGEIFDAEGKFAVAGVHRYSYSRRLG